VLLCILFSYVGAAHDAVHCIIQDCVTMCHMSQLCCIVINLCVVIAFFWKILLHVSPFAII
jgi:hypothetical protein